MRRRQRRKLKTSILRHKQVERAVAWWVVAAEVAFPVRGRGTLWLKERRSMRSGMRWIRDQVAQTNVTTCRLRLARDGRKTVHGKMKDGDLVWVWNNYSEGATEASRGAVVRHSTLFLPSSVL